MLECNFSWKKIQRKVDTIQVVHTWCRTASGIACRVLLASQLTDSVLNVYFPIHIYPHCWCMSCWVFGCAHKVLMVEFYKTLFFVKSF